jgi:hypothetical protein
VNCHGPISFAGGIATDVHTFNLSKGYAGENNERISLNDAYVDIDGHVNQYVKAFISLSYDGASGESTHHHNGSTNGFRIYERPGAYDISAHPDALDVEQATITLSDFDNQPVFFQIGKQYSDYNRYTIKAIERTMTQVLTQTLRTSGELGFVTRMGFHGTVIAFDDPDRVSGLAADGTAANPSGHSTFIYGASFGFDQPNDTLGWDVGIGYMSNMTAANDVAAAVNDGNANGTMVHRVGAIAVYGHVNSGPFTLGANYATALSKFNAVDIAKDTTNNGAKPRALDLKAGYGFNYWCKNQNVYLGYQKSWESAQIPLPSSRWLLGYGINVLPNTELGAELGHDIAYNQSQSGTKNSDNSNTLGLRAEVKFG